MAIGGVTNLQNIVPYLEQMKAQYQQQLAAKEALRQQMIQLAGGAMPRTIGVPDNAEFPTIKYYGRSTQSAPTDIIDGKFFYPEFSTKVYTGNERRESYVGIDWVDKAWVQEQLKSGKMALTKYGNQVGYLVDPSIVNDPKFMVGATGEKYRDNTDFKGSNWTQFRDYLEGGLVAVGNFFYPGSSLVTSKLVSDGAKDILNSTLGRLVVMGSGLAGAGMGNMENYIKTYDAAKNLISTGLENGAGALNGAGSAGTGAGGAGGAGAGAGAGGVTPITTPPPIQTIDLTQLQSLGIPTTGITSAADVAKALAAYGVTPSTPSAGTGAGTGTNAGSGAPVRDAVPTPNPNFDPKAGWLQTAKDFGTALNPLNGGNAVSNASNLWNLASTLGGALLGGTQTDGGTSTQEQAPWGPSVPYLQALLQKSGVDLNGTIPFNAADLTAGLNPTQLAAMQSGLDTAGTQGAGGTAMAEALMPFASGQMLDPRTNPFAQEALSATLRRITEGYERNVMPGITNQSVAAGGVGGSRQGVAQGLASGEYLKTLGDTSATFNNNLYTQNYKQMLDAIASMGTAYNYQQQPYVVGSQVGDKKQATEQALKDNAWKLWQASQTKQQNAANTILGVSGRGSVSTVDYPDTNPALGALGGAIAGSQLYDLVKGMF